MSRPLRARGLKHGLAKKGAEQLFVAPFTGAWIETCWYVQSKEHEIVAPFTGAWIETPRMSEDYPVWRRRALYGRVD